MQLFGRHVSASLLALVLASCNTTDALTPQASVGESSTPITQADADRMAGAPLRQADARSPSPAQAGGGPQNTLEAQARALEAGNAVSPASSGAPPQWDGQEAAIAPTLSPASGQAALPSSGQPPDTSTGTLRFLPIIGAPVQAVTPLSRQLGAQARARGLTIRPSGDTSTENILKGYFSAFEDGNKVTIIYVWDILDRSGNRLHRMQGQENLPSRGSDPWAAVPASTMEAIADKTIAEYVGWLQSR